MGSVGYAEVVLAFYNKETRYPLRRAQRTGIIGNTGIDEADESEEDASSAHTGSDSK